MLIKKPSDIKSSEITPQSLYMNRRKFLAGAAAAAGVAALAARPVQRWLTPGEVKAAGAKLGPLAKSPFSTTEKQNSLQDISNYNNYYEFSTDKYLPAKLAQNFKTTPWTVSVEGEVMKPQKFSVDD